MSKCHGKESCFSSVFLGHLDEQGAQQELCVIVRQTPPSLQSTAGFRLCSGAFSVGFLEGCCQHWCITVSLEGSTASPKQQPPARQTRGGGGGSCSLRTFKPAASPCHVPGPGPHGKSRSERGALERVGEGNQGDESRATGLSEEAAAASMLPGS